eukprot:TRINITY_DN16479_c0_g1_i1.p2 TRINITY_DN16479_c0_g1~~TRINITY_DN16479_c0_g1_i1.p2  ORF type:complete len:300 (+),score=71.21 TRINITY_DN16479_c0_g1_i1:152-1051(+)
MLRSLVGSEMCIRDRYQRRVRGVRTPMPRIVDGEIVHDDNTNQPPPPPPPPGQANTRAVVGQPIQGYHAIPQDPQGQQGQQGESLMMGGFGDPNVSPAEFCCACSCPCCMGNPKYKSWWQNAAQSWFMTSIGIWSTLLFILYVIMASVSQEHVSDNTMLDFGGLNAPRVVHRGQVYRLLLSGVLCKRVFTMLAVIGTQMLFGWQQEIANRWGWLNMAMILVLSTVSIALTQCICRSNNDVYDISFWPLVSLFGARIAWLYTLWDVRNLHLETATPPVQFSSPDIPVSYTHLTLPTKRIV